jgi:hypothetical protein
VGDALVVPATAAPRASVAVGGEVGVPLGGVCGADGEAGDCKAGEAEAAEGEEGGATGGADWAFGVDDFVCCHAK